MNQDVRHELRPINGRLLMLIWRPVEVFDITDDLAILQVQGRAIREAAGSTGSDTGSAGDCGEAEDGGDAADPVDGDAGEVAVDAGREPVEATDRGRLTLNEYRICGHCGGDKVMAFVGRPDCYWCRTCKQTYKNGKPLQMTGVAG